ncbi:hypothetical protein UFOVP821_32 [uncultured Caudovirales phage]|uniref:Uncharacterized protein n=1 Tax=uncultured Caudovirales phage TaxID=2100421 RepID=A0A6J5P5P1_9CAUD|nr:hypothetical protein UFOVP821_32 [uncultured Caudovirales phage]
MATRAATISNPTKDQYDDGVQLVTWSGLLNGDDGAPVELPTHADRSVQVTGTFGASGNVNIEGSNDGTNYATLSTPASVALAITAAGIKAVLELPRYIRPRVTAGDGTTALVVTLLLRRNTR